MKPSTNTPKEEEFGMPIHMFLSINEGKLNHQLTSSIYLICRLFWNKEKVRFEVPKSAITSGGGGGGGSGSGSNDFCWTLNLSFVLERSIVDNMRNNFMIIEAWRQQSGSDSLLGTIKLPLHEFWLRLHEPSATRTFLTASANSMPIVGVDGWLSAYDPFTGEKVGEINTLLALGSQQQIVNMHKILFDKAKKSVKIEESPSSAPKTKQVDVLSFFYTLLLPVTWSSLVKKK